MRHRASGTFRTLRVDSRNTESIYSQCSSTGSGCSPAVKVAGTGPLRTQFEGSCNEDIRRTRIEPKIQALSWLVSQLRWEETLGDLRDSKFHDRRPRRPQGRLNQSHPNLSRLRTPAAVDRAIGPDPPVGAESRPAAPVRASGRLHSRRRNAENIGVQANPPTLAPVCGGRRSRSACSRPRTPTRSPTCSRCANGSGCARA